MTDAVAELEKVREQRARAAARVADLEREWRQAVEQSREASAQLAEVERSGASAARRHAAEEKLAASKLRAAEPWAERVEGARRALRDADGAVRAHVEAHLGDLVAGLEEDGRAAAERVNAAAAEMVAAHAEWLRVAAELGSTITLVARPSPGDVSFPAPEAEQAARSAVSLVAAGGERGPALERRNPPWSVLLGEEAAAAFAGTGGDELEPAAAVVA